MTLQPNALQAWKVSGRELDDAGIPRHLRDGFIATRPPPVDRTAELEDLHGFDEWWRKCDTDKLKEMSLSMACFLAYVAGRDRP